MSEMNPVTDAGKPDRGAMRGSSGETTNGTLERIALPLLGAAMAGALALIVWLGRGTTFSIDELSWVANTPGLDLGDALSPHVGHLILTSRLVYKVVLETLGSGYEPFRILTGLTVLLTAGLFFLYAGRRVGRVVALAPTLILLVFGSDSVHILVGNGFTVLLAISCGLGAMLAIDRGDRRGDLIACGLLCLGVVTYTVALAFVVGVAITVLWRADRWRRIWIVAVPVAIYAAWWLWALGQEGSSENQVVLSNILLIPAWAFQALGAVAVSLTGLGHSFSDDPGSAVAAFGPPLALITVAGVGWRLARGRVPATLWAAIGIALALWAMQAIAPYVFRSPDASRFLFPGAVAVLLVLVEASREVRWSRAGLIALYVAAAVGAATNLIDLRDYSRELRSVTAPQFRTDLGALELAGERANPQFDASLTEPPSILGLPFSVLAGEGDPPLGTYLEAASRYGALGYPVETIRAQAEEGRARADALIAGALGAELTPADPGDATEPCRELVAEPGQGVSFPLPPSGAVITSDAATGPVTLRRFASETWLPLAGLASGQPAALRIPADGAPDPWQVSVPVDSLGVCALR